MKEFKVRLEAMLGDLTEELKAIGINDPHNPSDWIAVPEGVDTHEADSDLVADVVEEWDGRQALVATLERRFNDIRRALQKIDAGTFGTCEMGNEAIENDRLEANPAARTCKTHMNEENILPL